MTSYLLRQREWEELRFEGSPLQGGSHSLEPANIWKMKNMYVNVFEGMWVEYVLLYVQYLEYHCQEQHLIQSLEKAIKKDPSLYRSGKKVPDGGERCHWRVGLTLNGSRYLAMSFPW